MDKVTSLLFNFFEKLPFSLLLYMKKWQPIFLAIITLLVYGQGLWFSFTNWDDTQYVVQNEWIRKIDRQFFEKAFTETHFGHYHPLTWLSLAIDYQLFGKQASGYHLHNLLLHLINVLLVFLIIRKIAQHDFLAFFVALAFSLHPFANESVMWVTERKNLLFVLFYLASMWFYVRSLETDKRKYLIFAFVVFVLSCLSKATAITLPVILLALLYLYNRLDRKNIALLIPFALVALFFAFMAQKAQQPFLQNTEQMLSFYQALMFSSWAFWMYVAKAIVPINMAAFHPMFLDAVAPYYLIGLLVFLSLAFFLVRAYKRQNKLAAFAIAFFLVNIVMYLPIFGAYASSYYMAERYTYLSYIGLFLLLFSFIRQIMERKKIAIVVISSWFVFLAVQSYTYGKTWANSISLWENVLKYYPNSQVALLNYGNALREAGKYADATKVYEKIDKSSSLYLKMLENRAYAYYMQKNYQRAIDDYQELLRYDSSRNDIKTYIVNLLLENEQMEIAKETALQILKQQPNQSEVWNSLGNYYFHRMQVDSAVAAYTQAINIKPSAMYYYNRANIYSQNNNLSFAIEDYNKALSFDSLQADYYLNRAITYYKAKDHLKALADFNRAIALNPTNKNYYINRATLYVSLNEINLAIADLSKALEIDPNDAEVLIRRSYLYFQTKQKSLSCNDAKRALALGYKQFSDWMYKVCQ